MIEGDKGFLVVIGLVISSLLPLLLIINIGCAAHERWIKHKTLCSCLKCEKKYIDSKMKQLKVDMEYRDHEEMKARVNKAIKELRDKEFGQKTKRGTREFF